MEFIMCVKMLKLSRHDKSVKENKIEYIQFTTRILSWNFSSGITLRK